MTSKWEKLKNFFSSNKYQKLVIIPITLFFAVVFFTWQSSQVTQETTSKFTFIPEATAAINEPVKPIPLKLELDENRVILGDKLFHDPQLSTDGTISCATCHDLEAGGTDRLRTSMGMNQHQTPVNSPTVFNSGFMFKQYWDGRVDTLEEQVNGPIETVGEMGGIPWENLLARLKASDEYVTMFREAYSDEITADNVRNAIATFERSLFTPNAPFDQYLRGNPDAITAQEKQGYELFKSYGCVTCHQGMLLGGNMFQTFGVMGDYFGDRGNIIQADLGRFNVTGNERDRYVFKVPTLRNITLTAPYFHDGNADTLDQAIKIMAKYQLGIELPQKDVDLIMGFLNTLTGEYKNEPL